VWNFEVPPTEAQAIQAFLAEAERRRVSPRLGQAY
jgi:hypothetical protein